MKGDQGVLHVVHQNTISNQIVPLVLTFEVKQVSGLDLLYHAWKERTRHIVLHACISLLMHWKQIVGVCLWREGGRLVEGFR